MPHHVYTTDAFFIDSGPSGEASKSYLIFSKELGMLRATAQGVRLLKSKLRFSLQDYSRVLLSVVRGKEVWRITNAATQAHFYQVFQDNPDTVRAVARIFVLMRRLTPMEEKHADFFETLSQGFGFLETETLSADEIASFECIVVLNLLFELGYLAHVTELAPYLHPIWSKEILGYFKPSRRIAYQEINKSLRESHL